MYGRDSGSVYASVYSMEKIGTAPVALVSAAAITAGTNPKTVSDDKGNAVIVYENGGLIYARLINSRRTTLSGPLQIDTVHATQTIVKVMQDGNGGAVVFYKWTATNLYAQWVTNTSSVLGRGWTTSGSAITTGTTTGEDFAYNYNAGSPYAVAVYEKSGDIYARSIGTVSWAEKAICTDTGSQTNPHIFLSGANTLISWDDSRYSTATGICCLRHKN